MKMCRTYQKCHLLCLFPRKVTETWVKINILDCSKTQLGMKADPKTKLKIWPWNKVLKANKPWPTLAQVQIPLIYSFLLQSDQQLQENLPGWNSDSQEVMFIPQLHSVTRARLQSSWLYMCLFHMKINRCFYCNPELAQVISVTTSLTLSQSSCKVCN